MQSDSFPATAARLGGRFHFRPDGSALAAGDTEAACLDDPDRGTPHEGTVELIPDGGRNPLASRIAAVLGREYTGTRGGALAPQREKERQARREVRARSRTTRWRDDLRHHFGI